MDIGGPMVFIDTNVVLRYLTNHPPNQAEMAASIVDEAGNLWITDVVITETAYVLRDVYAVGREDIVDQLMDFVHKPQYICL